jgi:tRNA A-37 threonylcarbamoyl transferase component Bud32
MFVGGVIREPGGRVVGVGIVHISPEPFYKLLESPCVEFLAFDDQGLLLNDISRTDSLRDAGLVPGAFRLKLKDPGVDLRHDRAAAPPDHWPLTRMAQSGSQGSDGVDSTGRRDVRGQRVLQAWSWLPELDMGLGAQRPEEETLAALAPIRTSLVLSALVFAGAGIAIALLARRDRARKRASGGGPFGSYQLDRRIGRGATADVFLANHAYLKRPAALKILNDADPSLDTIERFEREARLASRLGHPNTIQVFDYGEAPDGRLYLAMEYVKGLNLAQLSTLAHPLPVSRVVYILKQVAGSLDEAHQLGLIHRDLKPSNIMIESKGGIGDRVKVLDFGIASQVSGAGEDVTRSASVVGTPAFIAPERLRSPLLLDPRSDIYSFGAVAFHLLTGRTVFESDGPAELVYQTLTSPRPSPSQLRGERLPEELESLVLDCLSVSPSARPPTFRAVREKLKAIPLAQRWGRDEARVWWTMNGEEVTRFVQAIV